MQIREATDLDIPEILEVLKASLGETSSKKTAEVWRYKHVDNPFGRSLVLVAEEDNKLIGVRAFMRWQWQLGENVYSTFRAVDTATHPEHQGKGVFKKLTLKAIEIGRENGDHFIFNTPNSQSLPGYLKMDWKEVNKLKINLSVINPIHFLSSDKDFKYTIQYNTKDPVFKEFVNNINSINVEKSKLFTVKSPEYLNWRFENNPLQKYDVKADDDFYLATYIKEHKYFKELRIVEHLYDGELGLKKIKSSLKNLTRSMNVHIISSSHKIGNLTGVSG